MVKNMMLCHIINQQQRQFDPGGVLPVRKGPVVESQLQKRRQHRQRPPEILQSVALFSLFCRRRRHHMHPWCHRRPVLLSTFGLRRNETKHPPGTWQSEMGKRQKDDCEKGTMKVESGGGNHVHRSKRSRCCPPQHQLK